MGSTKKVRSAGRYGVRYGLSIRKRLLEIEDVQKKKHACPDCGAMTIKRQAKGIFYCKKCGIKFTGGTFLPVTQAGGIVQKMVSQRNFAAFLQAQQPVEESPAETPRARPKKRKAKPSEEPEAQAPEPQETGAGHGQETRHEPEAHHKKEQELMSDV